MSFCIRLHSICTVLSVINQLSENVASKSSREFDPCDWYMALNACVLTFSFKIVSEFVWVLCVKAENLLNDSIYLKHFEAFH